MRKKYKSQINEYAKCSSSEQEKRGKSLAKYHYICIKCILYGIQAQWLFLLRHCELAATRLPLKRETSWSHVSSLRNKIRCRTCKKASYVLSACVLCYIARACVFTRDIQNSFQIIILFSTISFFLWNTVSLLLPQIPLFPVHFLLASFLPLLLLTFQYHQLEPRQLTIYSTYKISIVLMVCFKFKFNMKKEEMSGFNAFYVFCSHLATDYLLDELQTFLETEFHGDQQGTCQTWSRIPGCWSVVHTRHLLAVPEGDKRTGELKNAG